MVAFSGRTYFIAELWNKDVNIITMAFSPISTKNNGLKIFPKEIELVSNISDNAKKAMKLIEC